MNVDELKKLIENATNRNMLVYDKISEPGCLSVKLIQTMLELILDKNSECDFIPSILIFGRHDKTEISINFSINTGIYASYNVLQIDVYDTIKKYYIDELSGNDPKWIEKKEICIICNNDKTKGLLGAF